MKCEVRHLRLGEIIEPVRISCGASSPEVVGVDINHRFIPTRANLTGVDTSKYLVVPQGCFACNLMHIGRDERIPLAYNDTGRDLVITHAYYVFRVRIEKNKEVLPLYLYLYLCRAETDRYTWLCTDSSVRGNLPENRLFDITIPIPNIETQQQLVNVWNGLDCMKQDDDAQAVPLMELCMSYLKSISGKYQERFLADYIEQTNERNSDGAISDVRGLSTKKEFREPQSRVNRKELHGYKVLHPHEFAFVPTTDTWRCLAAALSEFDHPIVVSPIYCTFRITRQSELLPEFLMLMYLRPDFDRYARYHSWGSARENFSFEDMQRVKITIPPLSIQQSVVDLYTCAKESQEIAREADFLRKKVAPALIQKAIHI